MSKKLDMLELYELMEEKKHFFLDSVDSFMCKVNSCVETHDLNKFNLIFDDMLNLDEESKRPFICSSSSFRLKAIKQALNQEQDAGISLFWEDVSTSEELLSKYNKTIFMLRRLYSDLPEQYKNEAHEFLHSISPFTIAIVFSDPTVIIGKSDFIFITLAMDCLKEQSYRDSLRFLLLVKNKNHEIMNLISQLDAIIKSKTEVSR